MCGSNKEEAFFLAVCPRWAFWLGKRTRTDGSGRSIQGGRSAGKQAHASIQPSIILACWHCGILLIPVAVQPGSTRTWGEGELRLLVQHSFTAIVAGSYFDLTFCSVRKTKRRRSSHPPSQCVSLSCHLIKQPRNLPR